MMTICYKTIKATQYDNGKTCDEFLFSYFFGTKEEAEKKVKQINETKPLKIDNEVIDWNRIKYFFIHEQEEFY